MQPTSNQRTRDYFSIIIEGFVPTHFIQLVVAKHFALVLLALENHLNHRLALGNHPIHLAQEILLILHQCSIIDYDDVDVINVVLLNALEYPKIIYNITLTRNVYQIINSSLTIIKSCLQCPLYFCLIKTHIHKICYCFINFFTSDKF